MLIFSEIFLIKFLILFWHRNRFSDFLVYFVKNETRRRNLILGKTQKLIYFWIEMKPREKKLILGTTRKACDMIPKAIDFPKPHL